MISFIYTGKSKVVEEVRALKLTQFSCHFCISANARIEEIVNAGTYIKYSSQDASYGRLILCIDIVSLGSSAVSHLRDIIEKIAPTHLVVSVLDESKLNDDCVTYLKSKGETMSFIVTKGISRSLPCLN